MGSLFLRASGPHRGDDPDLSIGGAFARGSTSRSPGSHASCLAAASHSSRPLIGIS